MAEKTVIVEFVADVRKLVGGMKRAEKGIGSVTSAAKRLGLALGGVFSLRALTRTFQGTMLDTKMLIDTAKGVGVATQEYERLAFVLEQLGATPTSLKQAFGDLQLRLGDVGKIYDKYFKQIGLDPAQLRQMAPAEQLETTLKALTQVENQARRAALAGRVLGEESSRQLLKVVNQGVDEIERVSRTFVPSIEPEQEAAVNKYVEKVGEVEQAWKRVKTQVALSVLTDENLKRVDKFTEKIVTLTGEVDLLRAGLPVLAAVGVAAFAAILAAIGPVGAAIVGLSAAITSIVVNWDDLVRSVEWVWDRMKEKVRGFAENIHGSLNPFMSTPPPGPTVPLSNPLHTQPGFSKSIAPNVTQYFTVHGVTMEQVESYARRKSGSTNRAGTR